MYKVIVALYFCFSLLVFAEVSVKVHKNMSVQTLVKQVKFAKPSDKRVLMNRLKVMLRKSNKTHRMQVMKELKQSFSTGNATPQRKQKHKNTSTHCGTQQPKHKRLRDGSGKGKKQRRGHPK